MELAHEIVVLRACGTYSVLCTVLLCIHSIDPTPSINFSLHSPCCSVVYRLRSSVLQVPLAQSTGFMDIFEVTNGQKRVRHLAPPPLRSYGSV